MKSILLITAFFVLGMTAYSQSDFVDLGLPSGTLWKTQNEDYGYYTGLYSYDAAIKKYGNSLPTKEQYEELLKECQWRSTSDGMKVFGPNGNSIEFPAAGFKTCYGYPNDIEFFGHYWSSTSYNSDNTYA